MAFLCSQNENIILSYVYQHLLGFTWVEETVEANRRRMASSLADIDSIPNSTSD